MHFHDRTSYLAATSAWRVAYARHSTKLRALKLAFKQAQREGSDRIEPLRSEIVVAKHQATSLLTERHHAKQEAQSQWLAERKARQTAAV